MASECAFVFGNLPPFSVPRPAAGLQTHPVRRSGLIQSAVKLAPETPECPFIRPSEAGSETRKALSKGAVKLHLVLDHDKNLPCYSVLTEGKGSEVGVAKAIPFQPGTTVVFDRGYPNYDWWLSLTRGKVHFVTRLKDNASYGVVEELAVPPTTISSATN